MSKENTVSEEKKSGVINKLKGFGHYMFIRTLGFQSVKENAYGSFSRIGSALDDAKGMISSTRKTMDTEGNAPGQFLKVESLANRERLDWLRVAISELCLWVLALLFMMGYVVIYGFGFSVAIVMVAILMRAAVVGSNVLTVRDSFEVKPSLSRIFKKQPSQE